MVSGYQDFRVGLRVVDNGEKASSELWTPWASQAPGEFQGMANPWTGWVFNAAKDDPDGLQIGLETRWNGPVQVRDFRVGIQMGDKGEKQARPQVYTPWLSEILRSIPRPPAPVPQVWSGWSALSGDIDFYDPDGVSIGLITHPTETIPGNVGFHLGIRVADAPGQGQKITDFGPWQHAFALGGQQIWSPVAFDSDKYDFDAAQLAIAVAEYKPDNPVLPKPPGNPPIWPGNPF